MHVGLGIWPALSLDEALAYLDAKDAASERCVAPSAGGGRTAHSARGTGPWRRPCSADAVDSAPLDSVWALFRPLADLVQRTTELQSHIYMVGRAGQGGAPTRSCARMRVRARVLNQAAGHVSAWVAGEGGLER